MATQMDAVFETRLKRKERVEHDSSTFSFVNVKIYVELLLRSLLIRAGVFFKPVSRNHFARALISSRII